MQVIYGLHPVLEHLRSGGADMEVILLSPDKKGAVVEEILRHARRRSIPVRRESREAIDHLAPGKSHQGVLCLGGDFAYTPFESIMATGHEDSLLLILDSVTDPRNLGSLVRSAHCFGAQAVVIPKDRAAPLTPAAMKASAGSASHIPICQVANIARSMDMLKESGYWIYGTDAGSGGDCRSHDYRGKVALVLGSEGSGLRPLVSRKCDFLVTIPMKGIVDSLNVSVAGGILLYEVTRNRSRRAALSAVDRED